MIRPLSFIALALAVCGQDNPSFVVGPPITSPVEISGLICWWKPETITNANNTGCVFWPNSAGSSNHWTTTDLGTSPTFSNSVLNGLGGLYFDGVDDKMTNAPFGPRSEEFDLFVVARDMNAGAIMPSQRTLVADNFPASPRYAVFVVGANGGYLVTNQNAGYIITSDLSVSFFWRAHTNLVWIENLRLSMTSASISTNGITATNQLVSVTNKFQWWNPVLGDHYYSGAYDPNEVFKGMIYEVILFNRALRPLEAASINHYLRKKFWLW